MQYIKPNAGVGPIMDIAIGFPYSRHTQDDATGETIEWRELYFVAALRASDKTWPGVPGNLQAEEDFVAQAVLIRELMQPNFVEKLHLYWRSEMYDGCDVEDEEIKSTEILFE